MMIDNIDSIFVDFNYPPILKQLNNSDDLVIKNKRQFEFALKDFTKTV